MAGRKGIEGVEVRHLKTCRSLEGGRCNCPKSYRAHVWSQTDRRRLRRTFPDLAAAKAWRRDVLVALEQGPLPSLSPLTLTEAAMAWLEGARDGSVRNRKGEVYKPSSLRGYERCLRLRVLPELGEARLAELRRTDIQAFVDCLLGVGLNPSTIKNTLNPLQAIFRRALQREQVGTNPTLGLELPRVTGRRERIASPAEASALIAALPQRDRALWATALYAGLRRGELRVLRWSDVDLESGVIRVQQGWDDEEGEIEVKTRAGRRKVPIATVLRGHLVAHRLAGEGEGFAFGTSPHTPFQPTNVRRRALTAWAEAALRSIGLHEARHTFASLMIAAGVNAKALSTYMGHASVSITFDLYGHLMPGNESEAAGMLDEYLARSAAVLPPSPTPTEPQIDRTRRKILNAREGTQLHGAGVPA
jgi:integrase